MAPKSPDVAAHGVALGRNLQSISYVLTRSRYKYLCRRTCLPSNNDSIIALPDLEAMDHLYIYAFASLGDLYHARRRTRKQKYHYG